MMMMLLLVLMLILMLMLMRMMMMMRTTTAIKHEEREVAKDEECKELLEDCLRDTLHVHHFLQPPLLLAAITMFDASKSFTTYSLSSSCACCGLQVLRNRSNDLRVLLWSKCALS